jgi:hypothetical protein
MVTFSKTTLVGYSSEMLSAPSRCAMGRAYVHSGHWDSAA